MFTSSHGVVRLGAVSFALVASLASRAHAQFSSDPAAPLAVSATALDDTQARVAPAPNGSTYISYFSGSGYDVMLDRLDQSGVSMWGGPVVVEDRALSSTVDYGLASDAAGNAYISFNTVSAKTTFPVQKVTSVGPTGAIRWSSVVYTASGVTLGNGRVIVASDGFVWGGASANNTSVVQRFDAATGAASFGAAITISEPPRCFAPTRSTPTARVRGPRRASPSSRRAASRRATSPTSSPTARAADSSRSTPRAR
jgi:hypothetical protein